MAKLFLIIRFSSDFEDDIKLDITKLPIHNITPAWLRRMCRDLHHTHSGPSMDLNKHKLRFIRSGKMLTGLHWNEFEMELRSTKESLVANTNKDGKNKVEEGEEDKYIYVQCLIGNEEAQDIDVHKELEEDRRLNSSTQSDSEALDGDNNGQAMPQPVIGFDRLRTLGFSEEEIAVLRQQFQARMNLRNPMNSTNVGNTANPTANTNSEATQDEYFGDDEQIFEDVSGESSANTVPGTLRAGEATVGNGRPDPRELEERWLETNATDEASTGIVNNISLWKYNFDLLIGVSIGFLLGVFGLLLLIGFDKKTFNPRIQRAILAGLVSNFIFGLIRGW